MLSKKALSSNIAIFGLVALLLFLADLKYRQFLDQRAIETQEQGLLAQADTLQKQNDELSQSLQYLNSPSFKERVAREQLNLKKDGETIYSFGQSSGPETQTQVPPAASNFQKWWDYFFSGQ